MFKDPKKEKEYRRKHSLIRYYRRRREAFRKLGGVCVVCGSLYDLQLDHIDKNNKTLDVGSMWGANANDFWKEIDKCQILCKACHADKTTWERGFKKAKGRHGTESTYRYCHCKLCRRAHAEYQRKWRKGRKKGKEQNSN